MDAILSEDIILEDDFVLLRPLQESDIEHLIPFSIYEQDLWKYSLFRADGVENLRNYIQVALEAKERGREFPFIVLDKKSGRYAGSTRFYDINLSFKTMQLGYTWYGKDFQGTKVNKHCKYLLLEFAFERLNMERVEFRADYNNEHSINAMKSIGCKVDGVLRSNMPTPDGSRRDSIVLSILRNEWFDAVKENLKAKL